MSAPLCGVNENGQLEKSYIADGMPIGAVFPFYGTTPPAHTLACNGAAISRTTYAELFAVIGTTAGAGNGSTTFNVPDLRGMFIRGTGGNAAALGTAQGDAIRNIMGSLRFRGGGLDGNEPDVIYASASGAFSFQSAQFSETTSSLVQTQASKTTQEVSFAVLYTGLPVAAENRPVNVAMTYCIVYEN